MISWKAVVDGDDLVIGSFENPITISWFGGPDDPYDDGTTASGVSNKRMGVEGCSVPMYKDANGGITEDCKGSPLGPIPWLTKIEINSLVRGPQGLPVVGIQKTEPLLDVGPAVSYKGVSLNRPLDVCPQTFLDLGGDLKAGLLHGFLRIIGGAKYLINETSPA